MEILTALHSSLSPVLVWNFYRLCKPQIEGVMLVKGVGVRWNAAYLHIYRRRVSSALVVRYAATWVAEDENVNGGAKQWAVARKTPAGRLAFVDRNSRHMLCRILVVRVAIAIWWRCRRVSSMIVWEHRVTHDRRLPEGQSKRRRCRHVWYFALISVMAQLGTQY